MAASNEVAERKDDELSEEKKDRLRKHLSIAIGLLLTAVTMCVPTRAPLIAKIKKGDLAATAKAMGAMSAMAAAIEILINPVLGRLSDQYGRRPFMIAAPLVTAFVHSLVAMFPMSLSVQFIDRAVSGSMIFAFTNPTMAACSDVFSGKKLAEIMASIGSCLGIGATLGPAIGAKIGGSRSFMASAACFGLVSAHIYANFPETLQDSRRKQFTLAGSNPVVFLKLFKSKVLARLTITQALQSFGDYANIYDINNLYFKGTLDYSPVQVGNYAMSYGITQILGGKLGQFQIKHLGQKTHTLVSNMALAASMCIFGMAKDARQLAVALFLVAFSHQRSACIAAYVKEHGQAAGLGNAEMVAASTNLTAYIKVMAPLLYSNLYAWSTTKGRNFPGAPYFFIAALSCLAQLSFSSVDPEKVPEARA
eukprot:TRINITY_DN17738_c0_g1_i2.p1 TRINITY_DN17738_c0_g1~~TRINITY_DN17738_c0_g1_i2.p1  ORF type:complete len:422 (+),score=109.58 TRINITY_DN17738_c0_g1_i2:81-1346(+)